MRVTVKVVHNGRNLTITLPKRYTYVEDCLDEIATLESVYNARGANNFSAIITENSNLVMKY